MKERFNKDLKRKVIIIEHPKEKGQPIRIVGVGNITEADISLDPTGAQHIFPTGALFDRELNLDRKKAQLEKDAEAIRAVSPIVGLILEDAGSENSRYMEKLAREAAATVFYSDKNPGPNETIRKACAYMAQRGFSAEELSKKVLDHLAFQEINKLPNNVFETRVKQLADELVHYYPVNFPTKKTTPGK